jgi:AcrR family transcriptional regulator
MPAEPADPIQAQLIAARRNQILDAATRVFATKGVHRATVREVAREAGVADGTIYNYFENKEALLLGILDRLNQTQERAEHLAQGAEMDLTEFARFYLKQRMVTLAGVEADAFRVLLSELLVNEPLRTQYYQQTVAPTFALAEQAFQHWAATGATAPVDPRLTTRVMAGMVLGLMLLQLLGDSYLQTHWDELPDGLIDLLHHGLIPTGVDNADDPDRSTQPNNTVQAPRAPEAGNADI